MSNIIGGLISKGKKADADVIIATLHIYIQMEVSKLSFKISDIMIFTYQHDS